MFAVAARWTAEHDGEIVVSGLNWEDNFDDNDNDDEAAAAAAAATNPTTLSVYYDRMTT